MTNLEKVLIIVFLFSYLLLLTILNFKLDKPIFSASLGILTALSALHLNIYYLSKARSSLFKILIFLSMSLWIGIPFKIFHLPGADLLLIFGMIMIPAFGLAFLRNGFIKMKTSNKKALPNFIIGVILLIQFLLQIAVENWGKNPFFLLSHYILIATVITVISKRTMMSKDENYLITLLGLNSVTFILVRLII